ncbi:MAG: hypothetical protein IJ736_01500, partial [Firmicutes bacterium]|nr:hypothetical protein [Bacillota bacterium]
MKAKLKKLSLGVLAAALSVGLFTACTDSGSSSNTGGGSSGHVTSDEDRKDLEGVERPKSIKMMADTIMTKGNGIDD